MTKKYLLFIFVLCLSLIAFACSDNSDTASDGDLSESEQADADLETEQGSDGDLEATEQEVEVDQEIIAGCMNDIAVGAVVDFVTGLNGSEGIAFDGEGSMFISGGAKVLEVTPTGTSSEFASVTSAVGFAFDKDGNLMVAEWGEKNETNIKDGAVHRISPEGQVETLMEDTIANANFITRTPWGTWLVSDDMVPEIWEMTDAGVGTLFTDQIKSPNGMVFSEDGKTLYVASTFEDTHPVYQIEIENNAVKTVDLFVSIPDASLNDGVAMDSKGSLYVAVNGSGFIMKIAPDKTMTKVATDLEFPASIAFGEGAGFDPCSIYVTSLFGSKVYRINLGITGQALLK